MPRRMIDPSILTSESIAALSFAEQAHFVRLILIADDQGRFDARPRVIWRTAWAFQQGVTEAMAEKWTMAVAEQGIIRLWDIGGRRYGHFPKWSNYQRIGTLNNSKFPEPPPLDTTQRNPLVAPSTQGNVQQLDALSVSVSVSVSEGESVSVDGEAHAPEPPTPSKPSEQDELPFDDPVEPEPDWLTQLKAVDGYPANPRADRRLYDWTVRTGVPPAVLDITATSIKAKLIWVPPKRHWTYNGKPHADIRATFQNWVRREMERNVNGNGAHKQPGQLAELQTQPTKPSPFSKYR